MNHTTSAIQDMPRAHLKKKIWTQGQGGINLQPADILEYDEELKREPNVEIGFKDFFEIGSNKEAMLIRYRMISLWVYHIIRLLIATVFIWSGLIKISDPNGFAIVIDAYGLVPETWVMTVAIGLSFLELIAGLGLLIGVAGSLSLTTGLLLLFVAVLTYGIVLGLDVDCGCFGPGDPEAEAFHGLRSALYRDGLILAGIVYLYAWRYCTAWKPMGLMNLFRTIRTRREA